MERTVTQQLNAYVEKQKRLLHKQMESKKQLQEIGVELKEGESYTDAQLREASEWITKNRSKLASTKKVRPLGTHPVEKKGQKSAQSKAQMLQRRCLGCNRAYVRQIRPLKGGYYMLTFITCTKEGCPKFGKEQEIHRTATNRVKKVREEKLPKNSPYVAKTVTYSPEIKRKAVILIDVWNKALETHCGRKGTPISPMLTNESSPLSKGSLEAGICNWIMTNPETWLERWCQALSQIPGCRTFKEGYNGAQLDLTYMFKPCNAGLGLDKVASGFYNRFNNYKPSYRTEDGI